MGPSVGEREFEAISALNPAASSEARGGRLRPRRTGGGCVGRTGGGVRAVAGGEVGRIKSGSGGWTGFCAPVSADSCELCGVGGMRLRAGGGGGGGARGGGGPIATSAVGGGGTVVTRSGPG